VPDAVVVSIALNGQQFISDKTLHFRDVENTYTYYQDLLIKDFSPKAGPISGKTRITVHGYGLTQFSAAKIWVRFRDVATDQIIGG
jgi:hypothetical protein